MKFNTGHARRGFTIVELLVVVAIIGVLLGLISVAARGAIRNARMKRADAMCHVMKQGLAAYHAKMGRWPTAVESQIQTLGSNEDAVYTFSGQEADNIFYEIVHASVGSSASMPLLDAQALFVVNASRLKKSGEGCYDNHGESSLPTFCGNQNCVNGVDFSIASKKGKGHIPLKNMAYGYQATESGKFSRFWVSYNIRTDEMNVSRQNPKYKNQYPKGWQ